MNLIDLLQMNKPQAAQQQSEGLGPIMQFLSQNHAPQMPQMQMPQMTDYGAMYAEAALQKKQQDDLYEAHLKQKRALEEEQAQQLGPHAAELTDDEQIRAMIASGNPQEVAYGLKLAEDQQGKRISAKYDEKISYPDWLKASPEEQARMSEFMKLSHANTNIYTDNVKPPVGYRWGDEAHTSVLPLIGGPEDAAAKPLTESQAKAMSNLKVMRETSKQYDDFIARTGFDPTKMSTADSFAQGLMSIDSPLTDAFGLTPVVEAQGRKLSSPNALEYFTTVSRWNEIFGRDKSGGAIKNPEYRAWLMQYWPGPNDSSEVVANKTKARKAYEESLMTTANPEVRQQSTTSQNNYDEIINAAAAKHGIDPDLIRAQMHAESAGNPNAVSNKGAGGLMQLMPDTARQLGVTNVKDPAQNIFGGATYLKQQLDKFGNVPEALAAYNAGPGAVDKYNGIPPYKETKDYVNKIVDNYAASKAKNKQDVTKHPVVQGIDKNSPVNKERRARLEAQAREVGW